MRFLGGYRTNLTVLAVSSAMTLSGAFMVTFGPEVAVNLDNPFVHSWIWPIAVVLFGAGGVAMYLIKGMAHARGMRRALSLLTIIPLLIVLVISTLSGSETSLAWILPSMFFAIVGLWNDEPGSGDERADALPIYASAVLFLFGLVLFFPFPWASLRFPYGEIMRIPALLIGGASFFVHVHRSGIEWRDAARTAAGLFLLLIAVIAALYQNRYILAIFYGPVALVTIGFPFLRGFRLGGPTKEPLSEENGIILRFQNVAEVIAWSVFLFSYVHIYLTPRLQAPLIFYLFLGAFALFVYQYRFRPLKTLATKREFGRTSLANAVMLSVVSHFTGGLESPYIVFFVFVLLSGAVLADPRRLMYRIFYIVGYLLFEVVFLVAVGNGLTTRTYDFLLVDLFLVILTGFYVHRLSSRRVEVDRDLTTTNRELLKAIDREREIREFVSMQALELEQSRARMDAVLEAVADGVIAVDELGRVEFMNDAAESLLAASSKEAKGRLIGEVLPIAAEGGQRVDLSSDVRAVIRRGKTKGDSLDERSIIPFSRDAYLDTDGGRRYIEGAVVDTPGGGELSGAVITFRDVTYRHEVDRLKTDFISVAAHQIRTPLSSIRWFLELLNDPSEGRLNKNQKMFAKNAYSSARRMLALINGLLAVTRVEAGRVPVRPEPTDIEQLTNSIIGQLAKKIEKKGIDVHMKVEGAIPSVPLDRALAREVFSNLLDNAIRYSPEGGEALVRIEFAEREVLWSVSDSGIGIPENQKDRIFEKFFRATNAASVESQGTGLGLYLAKFIVGLWDGRIWFESIEGEGTTFHVTVPLEGMAPREGEVSLHA